MAAHHGVRQQLFGDAGAVENTRHAAFFLAADLGGKTKTLAVIAGQDEQGMLAADLFHELTDFLIRIPDMSQLIQANNSQLAALQQKRLQRQGLLG